MANPQDEVITLPRLFPVDARQAVARGSLFDVTTGPTASPWGHFRRDCRDILGALCLEAGYGPPYYFTPRPERLVKGWGLEGGAADLALSLLRDLVRRCDRGDFADREALQLALLPRTEQGKRAA